LLSDHREVERAQEEDVASLSQKWEQFLASSTSNTERSSSSSDEESASGTVRTKSPSSVHIGTHSRNSSASSIGAETPSQPLTVSQIDFRGTVSRKRTIIDPKTARPVTVKVDEEGNFSALPW
jgi:hypothetical protein